MVTIFKKKQGGTKVGNFLRKASTTSIKDVIVSAINKAGNRSQPTSPVFSGTLIRSPEVNKILQTPVGGKTNILTGSSIGGTSRGQLSGEQIGKNIQQKISGYQPTKAGASAGLKAASITASLGGSQEQVAEAYRTGTPIRSTLMSSGGGTNKTPVSNQKTFDTTIDNLSQVFSDVSAPSSAGGISPSLGTSSIGGIPDIKSTYGDISENLAYLTGDKEMSKFIEDNMNRELQMIGQQSEQKLGILDKMFGNQKTTAEIRQEQEEKYGVDFKQMMAERKGIQAELGSINQDYLKVREGMEQQINTITSSPYGTMDFLNNQIAQIERNAAPRLNYLSGLANIKSAELAAINEDWELADKYIQRAVDDSVADQENAIRRGEAYLELYSDTFDRIGQTYKDAYLTALDMAKEKVAYDREKNLMAYEYQLKSKYEGGGVSTGGEYGSSIYDFSISEGLKNNATPEEVANLIRIEEDLSPKEAAIVLRRARELSATIKPQVAETTTGTIKPKTAYELGKEILPPGTLKYLPGETMRTIQKMRTVPQRKALQFIGGAVGAEEERINKLQEFFFGV